MKLTYTLHTLHFHTHFPPPPILWEHIHMHLTHVSTYAPPQPPYSYPLLHTCTHLFKLTIYMPGISQLFPIKPGVQVQVYWVILLEQVALFKHGFISQGSSSTVWIQGTKQRNHRPVGLSKGLFREGKGYLRKEHIVAWLLLGNLLGSRINNHIRI